MKKINPFLHFNGNCKEAMDYYSEIFKGKLDIMYAKDANLSLEFKFENAVLHAVLTFYDEMIIMASDAKIGLESTIGNNNFIVINFELEEEIDRVYGLFSKDALKIREQLHKVFWGAKYAELIDKFGICWMFNFDYGKRI